MCQAIKAVGWENQFTCEGVTSLPDFSALVGELDVLDPLSTMVNSAKRHRDGSVPDQLQPTNVVRFAKRLDRLLDLLDVTANALAAEWHLRSEGIEPGFYGGGTPTIH